MGRSRVLASSDTSHALLLLLDEHDREHTAFNRLLLRHPLRATRFLSLVHSLPRVYADVPGGAEGDAIVSALSRRANRRTPLHELTAVIAVPGDGASYSVGASMQTLRRKVRQARTRGITWREVTDPEERRALLRQADAYQEVTRFTDYRESSPHNEDLHDYDLWLVAEDAEGTPVVLSVTPVAGAWASLRYFRTMADSEEASLARYLVAQVLVERLAEHRVRWLADSVSPLRLTPGLRHFQKMLGYRLVRVRLGRATRSRGISHPATG